MSLCRESHRAVVKYKESGIWLPRFKSCQGLGVGKRNGEALVKATVSVQLSHSVLSDSLWPYRLQHSRLPCSSLSPGFLRFMSIDSVRPSNYLILSSTSFVFNLSQHQGLFEWVGSLHLVAKVLELQLQHPSFQWMLGLISLRIDWFDLLSVQGNLKSLL